MSTLPEVISNEQMIEVNVDTQPFIDVISCLNKIVKNHGQKLEEYGQIITSLCTKEEFHTATDPLVSSINELSKRSTDALQQSEALTKEAIKTKENTMELINNRFNEMLVTTKLNQRNSSENLEQKIESVMQTAKEAILVARDLKNDYKTQNDFLKETKSNVQILGERVHHVNTEFIKFVNNQKSSGVNQPRPVVRVVPQQSMTGEEQNSTIVDNSVLIEQLEAKTKEQINAVQNNVADLLNDRLTALQKSLEVAVMHPLSDNSPKLNEVWAVTSQNRAGLLNAMTEQSLLSRRVDVLQQMIDNIQQHSSNPESPNRPMLSSIIAHQQAANRNVAVPLDNDIRAKEQTKIIATVDQLGGKMDGALQDIMKIKNAVNRNEKDVRDVVLAIVDEFKLIRTNASGLENLPPLNLATCVPSFFNNPSFTFQRVDEGSPTDTERSDIDGGPRNRRGKDEKNQKRNRGASSDEYEQNDEAETPRFHPKKISGLLHLISRPEHRVQQHIIHAEEQHQEIIAHEQDETKSNKSSGRSVVSTKSEPTNPSVETHMQMSPKRVEQSIIHVFDKQGMEEIKQSMNEFLKNKNELMSAVDRKVDREMVEKVFNKFRVIINGLNDRVDEMAEGMNNLATLKEIEMLTELVQQTKYEKTTGSSSLPIHSFGNPGDYICGEDGGVFLKGTKTKNENYSQLPPLQDRQKR